MQTQISPYMSVLSSGITFQDGSQKPNKHITPVTSKSIRSLETPNAFYSRQSLLAQKQASNVNFGFHLTDVPGFHCPCCGKMMYTKAQIEKLGARLSSARGAEVEKVLKPHLQDLHKVERQVAEFLIGKAKKNPKMNIKELVMSQRAESEAYLIRGQMKILDSAEKQAGNIVGETRGRVINSLNQIKQIVVEGNGQERFKRKKVIKTINHYALVEKNSANARILEDMSKKIEELPKSGQDFHAFITKYTDGKRNSVEISERLFTPNLPTREHIDPAWRNTESANHGPTSLDNSLSMCSDCNGERQTEEYYTFVRDKHPEMKENLPKHMNEVQIYVKKRDLPNYYSYFMDVRKRIRKQSSSPEESKPLLDFDTDLIEEFIEKKTVQLQELTKNYKKDKK